MFHTPQRFCVTPDGDYFNLETVSRFQIAPATNSYQTRVLLADNSMVLLKEFSSRDEANTFLINLMSTRHHVLDLNSISFTEINKSPFELDDLLNTLFCLISENEDVMEFLNFLIQELKGGEKLKPFLQELKGGEKLSSKKQEKSHEPSTTPWISSEIKSIIQSDCVNKDLKEKSLSKLRKSFGKQVSLEHGPRTKENGYQWILDFQKDDPNLHKLDLRTETIEEITHKGNVFSLMTTDISNEESDDSSEYIEYSHNIKIMPVNHHDEKEFDYTVLIYNMWDELVNTYYLNRKNKDEKKRRRIRCGN